MSVTIATVAGTSGTGLGSERHIIYAVNSGNFWAFAWTGTTVLASWYSPDGTIWTASTTTSAFPAHHSEGRGLSVGYKNIAGRDVVYILQSDNCVSTMAGHSASVLRATISGTTITYHTTATSLITGANDAFALAYTGGAVEFASDSKPYLASSIFNFYDPAAAHPSAADAGAAEQATPLTWTLDAVDSGILNACRSATLVDLGSGNMGLLTDDGNFTTTNTGVDWYTWNGSAWSGSASNDLATGTITSIGMNDWGAVAVSPTDVHLVYRNASGSLIHRRYNGTSWGAGQTIPGGVSPAVDSGIALTTDGEAVFLCVIDTDVAATVQSIKWKPFSQSGLADAWQSWVGLETSVQTRTWIGITPTMNAGSAIVYWTEPSGLFVSTTFNPPPDPQTWAFVQTKQGFNASASSIAVQFNSPVVSGNRIIVMVGCAHAVSTTLSSVTDNATPSANTYNADAVIIGTDNTYVRSAPIINGGGTQITVTVNISGADTLWVWIAEYSGLSQAANAVDKSGTFDGTVASTAHSASTATPTTAVNEMALFVNNDDGAAGSQTGAGGLTLRGSDAVNTFTSSFGDKNIPTLATVTGNVTVGVSFAYTAIVVAYQVAPVASGDLGRVISPRLSGLVVGQPLDAILDLQSSFLQPFNPPPAVVIVAGPTASTLANRGNRLSTPSRARSHAVLAALPTPTFASVLASRAKRLSIPFRAKPQVIVPSLQTPTFSTTVAARELRTSVPARSRSRKIVPATVGLLPTLVATLSRALPRSPASRARTRRVIAALQTPTVAALIVLRVLGRSPASKSRTRAVKPQLPQQVFPSVVSTKPMKGVKIPGPLKARPRMFIRTAPPAPGVRSTMVEDQAKTLTTRSKSRRLLGIPPPPPGVVARVRRNRILQAILRSKSRKTGPAPATLAPGVPPTVQRETRE